jgi:hypothetical protein
MTKFKSVLKIICVLSIILTGSMLVYANTATLKITKLNFLFGNTSQILSQLRVPENNFVFTNTITPTPTTTPTPTQAPTPTPIIPMKAMADLPPEVREYWKNEFIRMGQKWEDGYGGFVVHVKKRLQIQGKLPEDQPNITLEEAINIINSFNPIHRPFASPDFQTEYTRALLYAFEHPEYQKSVQNLEFQTTLEKQLNLFNVALDIDRQKLKEKFDELAGAPDHSLDDLWRYFINEYEYIEISSNSELTLYGYTEHTPTTIKYIIRDENGQIIHQEYLPRNEH